MCKQTQIGVNPLLNGIIHHYRSRKLSLAYTFSGLKK